MAAVPHPPCNIQILKPTINLQSKVKEWVASRNTHVFKITYNIYILLGRKVSAYGIR